MLHDVLRRLQRTEAALSLAYPSSAATLHQPSQQAPFALTQSNTAPQQHGSVYDSGSDCESETASEASLRHAIIQKAPHRHHRVSGLKLNSMQKSLSAAEAPHELSPVPAPRHQTFRSPAAVDHDQSTANLSSHSHSDYRSSSTHHAVFTGDQTQQTAATDMDEPEASSGVDLSKHTQDVKANWDRQPTASSATMSKPSSTSASGQVFHLQAIARTCDQSQASPSGQSAQKTFVTDRANAPLSGPSATEYSMQSAYDAVSVSPRQPTGSAAEQDDHRRTSTLQLQERLMTTTDNISNHKDTLAVQDSQYANVKTTTQCNRSMSDAGGSAGAMPRRFGSGFFRLRPDHNRFL